MIQLNRRRKSGKGDFAVSANMAYTQVNLGALKAAEATADHEGGEGGDDEQYEDPDKLARHGRRLQQRYAQPGHSLSPYELPVSSSALETGANAVSSGSVVATGPACEYATADEVGRSWKDTKIVDTLAEASQ